MATHETALDSERSLHRAGKPADPPVDATTDDEGGGAGKAAGSRGAGPAAVAAVTLLVLLPLLYVLSIGPVVWLFSRGYLQVGPESAVAKFYAPLEYVHGEVPWLAGPLDWYVELWRSDEPPAWTPPPLRAVPAPAAPAPAVTPAPASAGEAAPSESSSAPTPGDPADEGPSN